MDGYLDMMKSGAQYDMHKDNYPTVMTVFYSGTDLIIASYQKGGTALTYTRDPAVSNLVDQCLRPAGVLKSNEAKCGEMSAAQVWQKLHPGQLIAPARITTVTVISNLPKKSQASSTLADLNVHRPCSFDEVSSLSETTTGIAKKLALTKIPGWWL
jgi:hypothetical protein